MNRSITNMLWAVAAAVAISGCASSPPLGGTTVAPAAVVPELPANKTILVFDADTTQPYEILGEVEANVADQRVYNYEGAKDQAREYLKRVAYAKFGDRIDAIISYRSVVVVGGGGFWGSVGAVYGAKNTNVKASGVAVRFTTKPKK